jgi:acyl-CoA reductase-like NAD-dependent aldehyde dehydrogenase
VGVSVKIQFAFFLRDKPLALYIFSHNDTDRNTIISNTQSGGVCCNDTIMHLAGKL